MGNTGFAHPTLALARQRGQHTLAVKAYRSIIAQQPDLVYVRFDLAAMLYENKEYEAAKDQFTKVKADDIDEHLRYIAERYLTQIQRKIGWNLQAGAQYVQNSNVNNASSVKEFNIGPYVFIKNEEAMPKKAKGLSAFLALDRDINIEGNHYATIAAQLKGTRYWDESEYNEHTLRLEGGYKNQDIKTSFSLSPFYEQSWLGDARYSHNIGLVSEYSRWLSSKTQVIGAYTYAHKRYHDQGLQRYEGNLHGLSSGIAYFVSSTLVFNGGIDHQIDHLNAEDESSRKTSVRLGVIKEFTGGLSARTAMRYGQRRFDAPHFFLGQIRRDTEYQANVALWHRQLHFKGITPKLNYRYLKINSNLPAFYSRQSQQWYVSLEKTF
ncbi:surface lipoprotein assembly modifier [Neisseriaceae bacterium CLB008]